MLLYLRWDITFIIARRRRNPSFTFGDCLSVRNPSFRPHKSRRLPTQSAPFFRKLGHECRLRQLAQGKQAYSCTRGQASVRFRTAREEYEARPTSEALGVLVIAQASLATQGMVARLRLDLELRSARAISRLLPEGIRR